MHGLPADWGFATSTATWYAQHGFATIYTTGRAVVLDDAQRTQRVECLTVRRNGGAEKAMRGWASLVSQSGTTLLKLLDAEGNETIAELQVGVPYFREAGVEHDVINDNAFEFAFMEVEIK